MPKVTQLRSLPSQDLELSLSCPSPGSRCQVTEQGRRASRAQEGAVWLRVGASQAGSALSPNACPEHAGMSPARLGDQMPARAWGPHGDLSTGEQLRPQSPWLAGPAVSQEQVMLLRGPGNASLAPVAAVAPALAHDW